MKFIFKMIVTCSIKLIGCLKMFDLIKFSTLNAVIVLQLLCRHPLLMLSRLSQFQHRDKMVRLHCHRKLVFYIVQCWYMYMYLTQVKMVDLALFYYPIYSPISMLRLYVGSIFLGKVLGIYWCHAYKSAPTFALLTKLWVVSFFTTIMLCFCCRYFEDFDFTPKCA